jgi:hypothetical protein
MDPVKWPLRQTEYTAQAGVQVSQPNPPLVVCTSSSAARRVTDDMGFFQIAPLELDIREFKYSENAIPFRSCTKQRRGRLGTLWRPFRKDLGRSVVAIGDERS